MRNHKRLKVFGLADRIALEVYRRTKSFPHEEKFGLTAQIRRAAISIAANIVEGAARPTTPEFARFLVIAYASTRELEYELSIAQRLGYLPEGAYDDLADLTSQTGRALRALVVAVQRRARDG